MAEASTNTNPFSNVAIINPKEKKKPHNINIKNNKKEPKVKVNITKTDKQKYRIYKTVVEPNLFNKIRINETDDIVAKIQKAFGLAEPANTNYSKVQVAENTFNTIPFTNNDIAGVVNPTRRTRGQSYTSSKGSDSDIEAFKDYAPTTDIFSEWDRLDALNAFRTERYKQLSAGMRGSGDTESSQRITAPQISDISQKDEEELTGQSQAERDAQFKADADFIRKNQLLGNLSDALFKGQRTLTGAVGRYRDNKKVREEFEYAKELNKLEYADDPKPMAVSPIKRSNRILGLEFLTKTPYTAEVQAKLDKQGKDYFEKQPKKTASTATQVEKRPVGRPKGSVAKK